MLKTGRKLKGMDREKTDLQGIQYRSVLEHEHKSVLMLLKFGVSRNLLHVKYEWYWRMKKVPILLRKNNRYTGISVS